MPLFVAYTTSGLSHNSGVTDVRKTAIRLYQYLSLAQLLSAAGSLVCSGLSLKYGLEVTYGVPYYSGGFIIGTLVSFYLFIYLFIRHFERITLLAMQPICQVAL